MATRKPYEMTFAEFAEAIGPSWCMSRTFPSKSSPNDPEWLTSVWNSADNRWDYIINWRNDALKNELPPEAHKYQFDDLSLHSITAKLGLNPEIEQDNIKASEILAIRNAWITSIQKHYGQPVGDIPGCTLTNAAAAEYVLLSIGLIHPWIQEEIRQHLADQNIKKTEQAGKVESPIEMSSDPNWLNTQVIHVRASEPCPHEQAWLEDMQAMREEDMKAPRYWLDLFQNHDEGWASEFELRAWSAQRDIDIANQKITALQEVIEKQKGFIRGAERIIKTNKRHLAAMRKSKKIGRPEKSPERQEVAIKFTSQWVISLMDALKVNNPAQLANMINGSNPRNWGRWQNGDAVPTHTSLSKLLNAKITQGGYKGKPLHDVATVPKHDELLSLILLT